LVYLMRSESERKCGKGKKGPIYTDSKGNH